MDQLKLLGARLESLHSEFLKHAVKSPRLKHCIALAPDPYQNDLHWPFELGDGGPVGHDGKHGEQLWELVARACIRLRRDSYEWAGDPEFIDIQRQQWDDIQRQQWYGRFFLVGGYRDYRSDSAIENFAILAELAVSALGIPSVHPFRSPLSYSNGYSDAWLSHLYHASKPPFGCHLLGREKEKWEELCATCLAGDVFSASAAAIEAAIADLSNQPALATSPDASANGGEREAAFDGLDDGPEAGELEHALPALASKAVVTDAAQAKIETRPESNGEKIGETRRRQRTPRGGTRAKFVAALTAHHGYENGSIGNREPITVEALAKAAGISTGSVSTNLNAEFKGHGGYVASCRRGDTLARQLKLMNGEIRAHVFLQDANQVADERGDQRDE